MAHHPAYKSKPFHKHKPKLRKKAEDLFDRAKARIGAPCVVKRTCSYTFRVYFKHHPAPRTYVKIILVAEEEGLDGSGVYVLLRADSTLDGWLEYEPWHRADPSATIRIVSVLFYYFRLSESDDLDAVADAIDAVIRYPRLPARRVKDRMPG